MYGKYVNSLQFGVGWMEVLFILLPSGVLVGYLTQNWQDDLETEINFLAIIPDDM
ncbi:MAG: hypothetical protein OEW75_09055 [Cyclobacteriaceae bacterium]|nr:hypothetical protein [Cyclobacteriaceae bacterium]